MKLPNAGRAVADIEKLRDYSLNPDHAEGKHKARVFRSALGFTQADAGRLREMVLEAARTGEASFGELLPYGRYCLTDKCTPFCSTYRVCAESSRSGRRG
jgi:hypothetical protein